MPAIIEAAVGVDCSDYIEHYVYGCADLPLPELLKQQGIEMRWQAQNTAPSLNVLLDDGPAGLTIRTVYEQGAAHRAGLSRSEEHTSELQSRGHLVCRLLLEKKKTEQACQ